jgi:hypothetical protein
MSSGYIINKVEDAISILIAPASKVTESQYQKDDVEERIRAVDAFIAKQNDKKGVIKQLLDAVIIAIGSSSTTVYMKKRLQSFVDYYSGNYGSWLFNKLKF